MSEIKTWRERVGIGYESCDKFDAMGEEITELRADLAKAERDAARYRLIKEGDYFIVSSSESGFDIDQEDLDQFVDTYIDQAMQGGE